MPTLPQNQVESSAPASVSLKSPVPDSRDEFVHGSQLRIARTALLVASLLTFIQAGVEFFTAESQFESTLERERQRLGENVQLDQVRVKNARERYVRSTRVKALIIAGLGAALLILNLLVNRFPFFCTLGGLILFLGATITMTFFAWYGDVVTFMMNNWRSVTWELAITASLIMGVQAALQNQRRRIIQVNELMKKLDDMMMA
ncbi:MAG TPA: hypothetical protein PLN21_14480 [Gemmatales bacterium]|nr:hypothetical protein [Gemmatales bacterium]